MYIMTRRGLGYSSKWTIGYLSSYFSISGSTNVFRLIVIQEWRRETMNKTRQKLDQICSSRSGCEFITLYFSWFSRQDPKHCECNPKDAWFPRQRLIVGSLLTFRQFWPYSLRDLWKWPIPWEPRWNRSQVFPLLHKRRQIGKNETVRKIPRTQPILTLGIWCFLWLRKKYNIGLAESVLAVTLT